LSILNALGYQQLTLSGTAASLTVPAGANRALIECDGAAAANSRWRDDGIAPTSTIGMELNAGVFLAYEGNLAAFQAIAVSGSPILNISYYG
jgi:hypothetical protein